MVRFSFPSSLSSDVGDLSLVTFPLIGMRQSTHKGINFESGYPDGSRQTSIQKNSKCVILCTCIDEVCIMLYI